MSAIATSSLGATLLADDGGATLLLGDDFFPWIVLALGAAMIVGNVLALLRPPIDADGAPGTGQRTTADPVRPPVGRAVVMIGLGAVAAIWGVASLLN